MKYVYTALLLHAVGQEVNKENITKVLKAVGDDVDEMRVQALVAALSEVDIDSAIKTAPGIAVSPVPTASTEEVPEKKEEKKKEEEKEEEAFAGLGALFQ